MEKLISKDWELTLEGDLMALVNQRKSAAKPGYRVLNWDPAHIELEVYDAGNNYSSGLYLIPWHRVKHLHLATPQKLADKRESSLPE